MFFVITNSLQRGKLSLEQVLSDKSDPETREMFSNFTVKCKALTKPIKKKLKKLKVKKKKLRRVK